MKDIEQSELFNWSKSEKDNLDSQVKQWFGNDNGDGIDVWVDIRNLHELCSTLLEAIPYVDNGEARAKLVSIYSNYRRLIKRTYDEMYGHRR